MRPYVHMRVHATCTLAYLHTYTSPHTCILAYLHTCHACVHAHVHAGVHTCNICMRMLMHARANASMQVEAKLHAYVAALGNSPLRSRQQGEEVCTHAYMWMHTCIHAYIWHHPHVCIHMYASTCMHPHVCICMHASMYVVALGNGW